MSNSCARRNQRQLAGAKAAVCGSDLQMADLGAKRSDWPEAEWRLPDAPVMQLTLRQAGRLGSYRPRADQPLTLSTGGPNHAAMQLPVARPEGHVSAMG
jgi:hypothetical protein